MKTVAYKGYQASVEFDDGTLFVKVLHIDDLLIAEVDKASEAQQALEGLINAYLQDCADEGREPTHPFKGSFNVRISPEVHRRVAMRAADEGMTLNKWICASIEEKLECGKLSQRIDGVFSKSKAQYDEAAIAQLVGRHAYVYGSHERVVGLRKSYREHAANADAEVAISGMFFSDDYGMKLHG